MVDTILLKAALSLLQRISRCVALVSGKVAHLRRLCHERAEIGEECVQVLVGIVGMIEPVVDEGLGDRLQYP